MKSIGKRGLGILFILGAALGFAGMNLFVNLAGELPTMQKVFFRNLFAAIIVFFVLLFSKEKFKIHGRNCIPWLLLRSIFGFFGVILNFYAIDKIGSISDASILNKLSPFFAVLFSVFLLKEKPKLYEIALVVVAFGGAMCVVRPTFDMQVLPALSGFMSGACAGFAYTCVRILGIKGERGMMTVFFFSAFSTLVALPFFILGYTPMSGLQWLYLILAGVSATVGHFCITAAYRSAPAKEIAVFDYAQVLFAAILGYFILNQIPDALSFVGYAVIIGAAFVKWAIHLRQSKRELLATSARETPSQPPLQEEGDAQTGEIPSGGPPNGGAP